jgi:S-adenosylmethionine hydrolase
MSTPVITFLTDYGLDDAFVGICHAVIAGICPEARIIDLTHGIPRHDVRGGAVALRDAIPFAPAGVHLAVVDPDVGAARRAVAVRAGDGRLFVGPDNGLLWPAAAKFGGVVEAVDVSHSSLRLEPVSATFHGRDVFAPIAAHLAAGIALAETGDPCDPGSLVTLELPHARHTMGALEVAVLALDRFGNAQLGATHEDVAALKLGEPVGVELANGAVHQARYVWTFSDGASGELLLYEDASRSLALAVREGSAADRLQISPGDEIRLRLP